MVHSHDSLDGSQRNAMIHSVIVDLIVHKDMFSFTATIHLMLRTGSVIIHLMVHKYTFYRFEFT